MRASEAKKIERNSPFERGVATTGRQDREPSTDVRNHLGILPQQSTTLPTGGSPGNPSPGQWIGHLNDGADCRGSRVNGPSNAPPFHSRNAGGALQSSGADAAPLMSREASDPAGSKRFT